MVLDQKRVAEIWVPSVQERGSGYVLCPGCLLTAYHVVKGAASSNEPLIEFRLLGSSQWLTVDQIVWKDEDLDLVLLQFTENLSLPLPLPKVAQSDFNQRVDCNACGFPSFGIVRDHKKTFCREYRPEGWIKPTDFNATKTPGKLLMEIEGAIPNDMTDWKGISGAAVFSNKGILLGIILEGPGNLHGQQIHLISIGWVIQHYPNFAQVLQAEFQQSLEFYDPIAAAACDRYLLEMQIRQIEAQSLCSKTELADCELWKERFNRALSSLPAIDRQQLESCLAAIPARQLELILENLEKNYPQIIREVWHHTAPSRLSKIQLDIGSIHALLLGSKDSALLARFLSTLVNRLEQVDSEVNLITEITELAQKLGQPIDFTLIPKPLQTLSETQTAATDNTLILIKLKSTDTASDTTEYSLNLYQILDSQLYQDQAQQPNSELHSAAHPLELTPAQLQTLEIELGNAKTIIFRLENTGDLENRLKEKLTDIIQALFETYDNLRQAKPHILFYVSKSLLSLDFHNLDFDLIDTLGLQFPIAVSCLDRYEQPESPLHRFWRDRWNALRQSEQPLNRHLQDYDTVDPGGKNLDFGNPKVLNKQLKQIDNQGKTVVGLNFNGWGTEQNFLNICDTLFATGLGVFLLPQQPLTATETENLNQALDSSPDRFLTALKETYRINADSEAGTLTVLMDNPYLPLPDIEYF